MWSKALPLAAYFTLVLILGFLARRKLGRGPGEYFLAGRGLSPLVLVGTMAATNFSAFTVFGASGAGYRDGLAFLPIMAFGTGFMALTFWLVGRRVWELGRQHGLVTPAELVQLRYGSRPVGVLFALAMVIFTVPYLALQPLAAGKVLGQLFGWPPWAGAALITGIILLYTLRGGLRAVAWTDVLQGVLMLGLMILALILVAQRFGGWTTAMGLVLEQHPELMSRPGAGGRYSPATWLGFLLLWFCCDPMFPQLFQRFYAARSERALAVTTLAYPLLCTLVFALPISLGLLGRLELAGLTGAAADDIVPLLMTRVVGDLMGTLILAAGLAALMSTMDSQLLTLGSIFSRDLYPLISRGRQGGSTAGRLFVVLLALSGLLVAVGSDATILSLGLTAFTGLAALFPTVLLGLYLKRPRGAAAITSILAGEAVALAYHLKWIITPGLLPALPVILVSFLSYGLVQALLDGVSLPRPKARSLAFGAGFLLIFLAAQDYWRWGRIGSIWAGWPGWVWYFMVLSLLQTILAYWWMRPSFRATRSRS